jgi:bifunctional DNase/RNase
MALVEMVIDSVRQAMLLNEWVVLLKEKLGQRFLPVYLGEPQAKAIKQALMNEPIPESLDDQLSLIGIDAVSSEVKVVSLVINEFDGNTFHAKLLLTYYGKSYEFACPAVKALSLAVRSGTGIYAEERVLAEAGVPGRN